MLVGLEGDVVKTLQSIKKGIELLDTRRTDLRAGDQGEPESEDGVEDDAAVAVEDDEGLTATARR
ncbi:MAG TPA: hypothetical protein VGO64_05500 [Candidatus Limnocylindrales bacterium]|nr:hypothetical protein [Candidatus Limnocylindrales bacterium]